MGLIPGFEGMDLGAVLMASLQHTLTPQGLLSQSEAANQQQAAELAARTKAASEAAATAGTAYQGAAAAPPPQLDPLAQSMPQFAGNVASILSGDKSYSQRAHENLKGAQDDLIRARMDNLTALKDTYDKKAAAAEAAGNLEIAEKSRKDSEQLAKTLQVLLQTQQDNAAAARLQTQETGDTARTRMNNATSIRVAEIGANAKAAAAKTAAADYFDSLISESAFGNRYLDLTNVPTPTDKHAAMAYAKANGLKAINKETADRFATIKEVTASMDDIDTAMSKFLPKTAGQGARGAVVRLESAGKNVLASTFQTNDEIAAFNSTSIVGIRAIQALAAGAGSGFRLNQSEVNMMMQRWPKITDTYEKAKKNLDWERNFLKRKEESFFGKASPRPTTSDGGDAFSDPDLQR
jgi:hypothetical protein